MPVDDDKFDGNPFDVIDEDFLLTDGDMNLLDNTESPMVNKERKNPLHSSIKRPPQKDDMETPMPTPGDNLE